MSERELVPCFCLACMTNPSRRGDVPRMRLDSPFPVSVGWFRWKCDTCGQRLEMPEVWGVPPRALADEG